MGARRRGMAARERAARVGCGQDAGAGDSDVQMKQDKRGHSRREAIKAGLKACATVATANAAVAQPVRAAQTIDPSIIVAGQPIEIVITPASASTTRISFLRIEGTASQPVQGDGSLIDRTWPAPAARIRTLPRDRVVSSGDLSVVAQPALQIIIKEKDGRAVQQLRIDRETGASHFHDDGPLLAGRADPIRSPRIGRSHAGPGRLSTANPWRARADPLDHRGRRLGAVLPSAVRHVRLHRIDGPVRTRGSGRRSPPRPLRRLGARAGGDHGRVRAAHRPSRNAAALVARLPAIARWQAARKFCRKRRPSAKRNCRAKPLFISAPASVPRVGTRTTASSCSTRTSSPIRRR